MGRIVLINGEAEAPESASVSVYDRGFLYGDSVFETIRSYGGELFELSEHLERLGHSAERMGIAMPLSLDALAEEVKRAVALSGNDESYVRLMLTRGTGPMGLDPALADTPLRVVFVQPLKMPPAQDTEVEFRSKIDGCMHACGHDTHTAMLSTAARVLSERRDEIAGRVLFMFQPGEEGHHGAKFMLEEGLLDVPNLSDGSESPVDAAFAIHMTSALPTGWVSTRRGAVMASADTMSVVVTGKGGHASEPHRAVDPIPVACEIVTALNVMITRNIDPFDPAVLTIAQVHSGTVNNVIPETAFIEGTIRAVSGRTRQKVHDNISRVAENIAAAHDCSAEVHIGMGYPVTSNNDRFADFSLDLAREVAPAVVELPHPVMGAEDFSYVLEERPGAMVFLGATPHGVDLSTVAPNHSNRVHFEEKAMATGIALYSATALRHLAPA